MCKAQYCTAILVYLLKVLLSKKSAIISMERNVSKRYTHTYCFSIWKKERERETERLCQFSNTIAIVNSALFYWFILVRFFLHSIWRPKNIFASAYLDWAVIMVLTPISHFFLYYLHTYAPTNFMIRACTYPFTYIFLLYLNYFYIHHAPAFLKFAICFFFNTI